MQLPMPPLAILGLIAAPLDKPPTLFTIPSRCL
jgi:hypothetical protein